MSTFKSTPFPLVDFTPPSQQELLSLSSADSIETLGLPTRIQNALKRRGVGTIGEFCLLSRKDVMKVRNIGPKSAILILKWLPNDIKVRFLKEANIELKRNIDSDSGKQYLPKISDYPDVIDYLLGRLKDRRLRKVIELRFGIYDGTPWTLEEIGKAHYSVSRERIRQLEEKALRRLRHPSIRLRKSLGIFILEWMAARGYAVDADEADGNFPETAGLLKYDGSSILDLLHALRIVDKVKLADLSIYSPKVEGWTLDQILKKTEKTLLRHLKALTAEDLRVKAGIREILNCNYENGSQINSRVFLEKLCRLFPKIGSIDTEGIPQYTLFSNRRYFPQNWGDVIYRVFEAEDKPLHFTEVADKANLLEIFDRDLDVRRAHGVLIDDKRFAHTGVRGTYGLTEWGIRKESMPALVTECLKTAGFPLHFEQIYYYVSKYKDTSKINLSTLLNTNKSFVKTGNNMFWLKEAR